MQRERKSHKRPFPGVKATSTRIYVSRKEHLTFLVIHRVQRQSMNMFMNIFPWPSVSHRHHWFIVESRAQNQNTSFFLLIFHSLIPPTKIYWALTMNQKHYWKFNTYKIGCALFPHGACSLVQEKHVNQMVTQNNEQWHQRWAQWECAQWCGRGWTWEWGRTNTGVLCFLQMWKF